jgi:nicotinamide phosphoribosyltransferase
VEILCGHGRTELTPQELRAGYPEFYTKGLIECLWETFGGTINEQGYKVLDPHIGAIYGDSITLDRQIEIYTRLEAKGFASTNIVLGVGSFTYQFTTRDTFGYAAKGAWFENNGKGIDIYKEPITDDGTKKSLKGKCAVKELENGVYVVQTQCTDAQENSGLLQTIYENGNFHNQTTLTAIRAKVNELAAI